MYDRAHVATISDLYRRICGVTTLYTFTHPVEPEDVDTVRAELAAAVPECNVFAMLGADAVHFDVVLGGRRIYNRSMRIQHAQV